MDDGADVYIVRLSGAKVTCLSRMSRDVMANELIIFAHAPITRT
jgi:hypothetical protein